MRKTFDSIVIGAGQAGPFLAARLAGAGRQVALIERKMLGGTCVNTGCTPTKTLISSARVAQQARDAARFGVHIGGEVKVAWREVQARAEAISAKSREGLGKMLDAPGCTLLYGQARFISANEVQVGEDTLAAEQIFLNVGGRSAISKLKGIETVPFLTNSTVLRLPELPKHLVIVGGGYIGVEFAQMFRRFGCEVTVVERGPHLIHNEDPDAVDVVEKVLSDEGVELRLGSECIAFSPLPEGGVCVHVDCESGDREVHGTHVLLAMGRVPNTADLGLDAAGVKMDEQGFVVVDEELKTSVPHIFAMGDCNRRGAFTHTSYNDFEIVAGNLLDGESRKVTDRIQAHALYSDPPLAQIGMTEQEARKSGKKLLTAKREMTAVGRAVEKGETTGFMKLIVCAETKKILGATILGVGGDEAIHCVLDVMYADAPYTLLQHAVHIHPTVAELLPTLAGSLKPAN